MSSWSRRRTRPFYSGVRVKDNAQCRALPSDVLLEILQYITCQTAFATEVIDGDVLLAFSHVSRLWSDAARSSRAWCDISIYWPESRIKCWLSRAADRPLRLVIDDEKHKVTSHSSNLLAANLTLFCNKFRSLAFLSISTASEEVVDVLIDYLFSWITTLTAFEVDMPGLKNGNVLRSLFMDAGLLSSLRKVVARGTSGIDPSSNPKTQPVDNLRELWWLSIWNGQSLAYEQLCSMSSLRHLTISHVPYLDFMYEYDSGLAEQSAFELPSLVTLYLDQPGAVTAFLTFKAHMPNVQTLTIGRGQYDSYLVKQVSRACSSVTTLKVQAQCTASFFEDLCNPSDHGSRDWREHSFTSAWEDPDAPYEPTPPSFFPALCELQVSPIPKVDYLFYPETRHIWLPSVADEEKESKKALHETFRSDSTLRFFLTRRVQLGYGKLTKLRVEIPRDVADSKPPDSLSGEAMPSNHPAASDSELESDSGFDSGSGESESSSGARPEAELQSDEEFKDPGVLAKMLSIAKETWLKESVETVVFDPSHRVQEWDL